MAYLGNEEMMLNRLHAFSVFSAIFCLGLSLFCVFSVSAGDSYLFEDGFESGDFSAWDLTPTGPAAGNGWANVISAEPFEGNYHANFSSVSDGWGYARKDFSAESSVYLRAYVRPKDRSGGAYAWILTFTNSSTNYNIALIQWSSNGYWTLGFRNGTVPSWNYKDSSVLASNNVWYCLELYHKSGSGDGESKLWINGHLEVSLTGLNNSDRGNPGRICVGKVGGTDDGIPVVYVDSVVLGTSYIGTGARACLVVRGMDNGLYYRSYNDSWGSWAGLPGSTPNSTGTAILSNTLHVVVAGIDGGLYHGSINLADSTFSGWTGLSGSTPSAPTLVSNSTALCLVVRGSDNSIYYRYYAGGSWGDWQSVPTGSTVDSPAAALLGSNLHIVVRSMDGLGFWQTILGSDGTVLKSWTAISGSSPSKPVLAASQDLDKLYLVVRGWDDLLGVYYSYYDTSMDSWGSWTRLEGATCDGPGAAISNGQLYIVVRGMDGASLWHRYVNLSTGNPSDWTGLSGATESAPTLAS